MTSCSLAAALSPMRIYLIFKEMGVAAVFGPGTSTQEIVSFLKSAVPQRWALQS